MTTTELELPAAADLVPAPTSLPYWGFRSGVGGPRTAVESTRPMPPLTHDEPAGYRWSWLLVGLVVTALFAVVVFRFYAPADSGVDQNAYLVGGRLIAEQHTLKYVLPNPYAYTGGMFVRMPNGVYYPKYPAGLPLLYAAAFELFGPVKGPVYAFLVSPASAVLAMLGTFFLARAIAGSFAGVMAAVLLGTSQVMLSLADNPNSHAACTAFIVWGMFLLVRWWQTGKVWKGALAGFLIGYAFTIRYTEGLLVLPVAIACLTRLRWRHWTPWVLTSAVGALGLSYLLFTAQWTAGEADGLRGYHYWISPGRTGRTVELVGLYLYAVAAVPLFVVAALSLAQTTWWPSFLDSIGWHAWRRRAVGSAIAGISLAAVWAAVNVCRAPTWAAVVEGDQWVGHGRWLFSGLALLLASYAAVVGALASLAAGPDRGSLVAFARSIVPGVAWCVPVVAILVYNSATMRHAAGYDTTHESELGVAFKWSYLVKNWEMVVRTFDDLELFFVVPFAIAGFALVFRRSWRVGVLLLSWVVPGVLLYTSYYWSMDFDVAYARFYLTFLPALCVAAAVAFHFGLLNGRTGGAVPVGVNRWAALAARAPAVVAVGLVVAVAASVSVFRSIHGLRDGSPNLIPLIDNYRSRLNLAQVGQHLLGQHAERPAGQTHGWVMVDNVPAGSVLFSQAGGGIQSPSNYIQFLRDWELFPADAFSDEGSRRGFGGGGNRRPNGGGNGRGGPGGPGGNGGGRGNGGGFMGFGRGGNGGPPGGGPGGGFGGPGGGPPGMANATTTDDQDQAVATPIQPEQQDYHASLYRNKSRRQLYQMQTDVIRRAVAEGRKVFVVVDKEALETFQDNLDEAGRYTYKTVAAWSDVVLPVDRDEETTDTSNRWGGGGGGRGNRRGGPGMAGGGNGMARLFGLTGQQNDWRIVQVIPAAK